MTLSLHPLESMMSSIDRGMPSWPTTVIPDFISETSASRRTPSLHPFPTAVSMSDTPSSSGRLPGDSMNGTASSSSSGAGL